jgi:hypothetical protein
LNRAATKTDLTLRLRTRSIGGHRARAAAGVALLLFWAPPPAAAQGAGDGVGPPRPYAATESREPCAAYAPARQPFFGDTHVHTAYSFDASTQDTRNTPRDAYRFAQGEPIGIQPYDAEGKPQRTIQLTRPIDFTVVTDHSEMLGEIALCMTPGSSAYDSILCRIHHRWPTLSFKILAARSLIFKTRRGICGESDEGCQRAAAGVWEAIRDAAEEAYDRSPSCQFTSFVGYEWTAIVEDGINLHRNVIFRNERVPAMPVSWMETPTAVDLWDHLERECIRGIPGCDALTIPHNSNLSAGLMFEAATLAKPSQAGEPFSEEVARRRNRWEPLIEIMQHKGDSECSRSESTSDEACGYEPLAYDRFGPKFSMLARKRAPAASNYVRHALKKGLQLQMSQGANPFRYGIVASTDTHIAAPGLTEEKDHPGHGGAGIGAAEGVPQGFPDDLEFNPGGLAVLWAEENSRDSLFAAMQRREAYGTSGTRPLVRFFGGWGFPEDLCGATDFAAQGYQGGVPMGGDLPPRPGDAADAAPRFALWAVQDPGTADAPGTPLQRAQIVKGWVEDGVLHERVIDVAGGDNGASVDPATCQPRGAGARSLCSVWTDPDFDAAEPAFYYARVLENPTCRWSQYVCNAASVVCDGSQEVPEGLEGCCAPEHTATNQERAWTSPVWYTP